MDQFDSLDFNNFVQHLNGANFMKSWSPANFTETSALEMDSPQLLESTSSSGRPRRGMPWNSPGEVANAGLIGGFQFPSILDAAANNHIDFAKNGIESELDEFDMYQTRLRSLAVDDRSFKSGAEIKAKKIACKMTKNTVCVFCKNNKETLSVYGTHVLKDSMGRVTCPILRRYTCPICGCSGDQSHTIKYCPYNLSCEGNDALLKTPRNSFGKKRPFTQ